MSKRMTVVLDDEAYTLLGEMAGGERKKGELLAELIREAAERRMVPTRAELEALRREVHDLTARVQRLEGQPQGGA